MQKNFHFLFSKQAWICIYFPALCQGPGASWVPKIKNSRKQKVLRIGESLCSKKVKIPAFNFSPRPTSHNPCTPQGASSSYVDQYKKVSKYGLQATLSLAVGWKLKFRSHHFLPCCPNFIKVLLSPYLKKEIDMAETHFLGCGLIPRAPHSGQLLIFQRINA